MSFYLILVTVSFTFPHLLRRVGQREPALGQQPVKSSPTSLGGWGNEWSGTSKAGRLLMLSSVEGEAEVLACKMGHVELKHTGGCPDM